MVSITADGCYAEVEPHQGFRLRDIASQERPQERLERYGAEALSDTELLAMLLRSGSVRLDVLGLSTRLIREAGSLNGLLKWRAEDFQKMPGIGRVKALQLVTVMEVARRVLSLEALEPEPDVSTPERVYQLFRSIVAGLEVEKSWVLCCNRRLRMQRRVEITSGLADSTIIHPREVFREAIRHGASCVMIVHNHPGGDPHPSRADIRATKQLRKAADTLGIHLLDHIIIGDPLNDPMGQGFYSFSEYEQLEED
ncbi:MAG: RadC family protein [Verrucomicrobiota bacterium]